MECLNCEISLDPYDDIICSECYNHLLSEVLKLRKERQEFLLDLNYIWNNTTFFNDNDMRAFQEKQEKWEKRLKQ